MSLGLPYKSRIDSFDRKLRYDDILRQLVEKCTSNDDYSAVCMIEEGAWGIGEQREVVQLKDGTSLIQSWTDPSKNPFSDVNTVHLELDLVQEFMALKSGQFVLRSALNKNPDLNTREEFARIGYLYMAVDSEAGWLIFPRQIIDGVYENNALNRICYAFAKAFSDESECFFSLMDKAEAKPIIESIDFWPHLITRHSMEIMELYLLHDISSIVTFVTEDLVQDAQKEGLILIPNQKLDVSIGYKSGGSGFLELWFELPENNKRIGVSPTYLLIDESEPLYETLKSYQNSLQELKWISI